MREIVHMQAGQCGNQIGAKVTTEFTFIAAKSRFFVGMNHGGWACTFFAG